jgi:hypothetical protein
MMHYRNFQKIHGWKSETNFRELDFRETGTYFPETAVTLPGRPTRHNEHNGHNEGEGISVYTEGVDLDEGEVNYGLGNQDVCISFPYLPIMPIMSILPIKDLMQTLWMKLNFWKSLKRIKSFNHSVISLNQYKTLIYLWRVKF